MTSSTLVDSIGLLAGALWLSIATYFQFIRNSNVHPGIVASQALIGIALVLGSSALALDARPRVVQTFAVIANTIFLLLGIGAWYFLETHADYRDRQQLADAPPASDRDSS